jgi:hypothetical protein
VATVRNVATATRQPWKVEADHLVYDARLEPDDDLARELRKLHDAPPVRLVGDSVSPRGIQAAIWDAMREVESGSWLS